MDCHFIWQDRDYLIPEAINRHGPLTVYELHEFYRRGKQLRFRTTKGRLSLLTHGTQEGGPYLSRPKDLNPTFGAKCEPAWYDLTPLGRDLVAKRRPLAPVRTDHKHHQAMGACFSAAIELGAGPRGLRFLSKEDIFQHKRCPLETSLAKRPLKVPLGNSFIEPDNLIGLEYPDAFRFFWVEIDRATHSLSTIRRKIEDIADVLDQDLPKQVWGISTKNLSVMFFTTAQYRVNNMKRFVPDRYADRFLFHYDDHFSDEEWRAPRHILPVWEPWQTSTGARQISKPA